MNENQRHANTSFGESGPGGASSTADQLADRATQVKERVSDMARTAAETIDDNRETTARGLQTAASALRDRADSLPGGERVTGVAHAAADKLSNTADYVRDHDLNRMKSDVFNLVKSNPGPSLMVAAVIGFLVGRSLSRN